jgi:hypothetical protein
VISFHAPTFPSHLPLNEFLRESRRIAFLGTTLRSLRGPIYDQNYEALQQRARAGASLTFCLVDPEAPGHVHQTLADVLSSTVPEVVDGLRLTRDALLALRGAAGELGDRISVFGLQQMPTCGVAMADYDSDLIRARLALYAAQAVPRVDPFIDCDRSTPEGSVMVDLCRGHFERLRSGARPFS